MNKKLKYLYTAAALSVAAMAVSSCANDDFFGEGEGTLHLKMMLNEELTRTQVDRSSLAESCVIYISNSQGLIHKFQGLENVPASISLKTGSYVAEAWAGDSVPASFDKKFYKTYQPFTVSSGSNNVVLNCKIANVVTSIRPETIDPSLLKNYTIKVANSRGELLFDESNATTDHGYFMMPEGDTDLVWTLTADDLTNPGTQFTRTGKIENVQPAHEYILNLKYGESDASSVGGGFITITVDDTEVVIDKDIQIYAAPKIAGIGFDIDATYTAESGGFTDIYVGVSAYQNFQSLTFSFSPSLQNAIGLSFDKIDMLSAEAAFTQELVNAGFSWNQQTKDGFAYFNFGMGAALLNNLDDGEYTLSVKAVDTMGRERVKTLNVEITDAPLRVNQIDTTNEEVLAQHKATLSATILKDDVQNPGIEFREQGTTEWTRATSTRTRSVEISFTISGLKANTVYEYRAFADGFVGAIQTFRTRAVYQIQNASFEDWSTTSEVVNNKNVVFPGAGSARSYWDSGNHGSATVDEILTNKSTVMVHSGQYSARLESKKAGIKVGPMTIGKHAAGNIFIGSYVRTDGTNGVLSLGKPFDGSHPLALEVYANYRPAEVTETSTDSRCLVKKGELDHGQIYVALTTEPYEVRTNPNDQRLFEQSDNSVIAYGQVTWTGNFGPDGSLQKLTIPLEYKAGREKEKAAYLVVVCAASKYGDFFAGGPGSVMYLDDFRLVYDGE